MVDRELGARLEDESEAVRVLPAGWWSDWSAARRGDSEAWARLRERVALEAHASGHRGLPTSHSIDPWLRLGALRGEGRVRELQVELLQIAGDAHLAGAVARRDRRAKEDAIAAVPVISVSDRVVATFLSGRPDGAMLDAVLDRLFRRAVALGASWAVVDLSGVEAVDDVLLRSLRGISDVGLPEALEVVVCGPDADLDLRRWPDLAAFLADV